MNQNQNNDNLSNSENSNSFSSIDNPTYSSTQGISTSQNVILSASHTEISSSPLPSPEILRGYDDLINNGAERFMKMVEKEQENRFENDRSERERVKNELNLKRRGQSFAFVLILIFMVAGIVLSVVGQNVISYVMFGMTMVPAVGLFYKHKS